ncbi:molybdate ABC transporter permease subunit [uncultured Acetobacterium sp.]|uniref:molybdate ABC transporter permease subunit n=1 Tax=uncultured Acetobacterium sp. TaxID=217139 RepID=UPI002421BCF2|nr:molybdate ABC transporter permease subunit [uncultured Acetobacterium sp.]MBU4540141.1 molybdate ABC transporter permease subunit [Bacillota bacterium]MDP2843849.1 molybdate ABC transporter permease subunit [Acetobacterium sp.]
MDSINLFPLYLSLAVSLCSTLISLVIGLPIAYFLSCKRGRVVNFLDTLTSLPIVLPPTVLGYYLLVLLGRQSPVGQFLENSLGIMLVFTPVGVVIAATIVSIPYLIKSSKTAFLEINEDYLNAARLLGRNEFNIFLTIIIPISWRGIVAGLTMCFMRALGDFGTTLMIGGNIPGQTSTMPIAIYNALQAGNKDMANMLVLIMTGIAVMVLFIINSMEQKVKRG